MPRLRHGISLDSFLFIFNLFCSNHYLPDMSTALFHAFTIISWLNQVFTIPNNSIFVKFLNFHFSQISTNDIRISKIWALHLLKWMARWLSKSNTYLSYLNRSSSINFFIHSSPLLTSVAVINSTLMVESAAHFCSLDCHHTTPPAKVII